MKNRKRINFLFVGEDRSQRAIKMNVTWKDGKLAAKTLFDALEYSKINLKNCTFCNLFEKGGEQIVARYKYTCTVTVVGMGKKVQKRLAELGVTHTPLIHPAARGKIRKKELYRQHVKDTLSPTSFP